MGKVYLNPSEYRGNYSAASNNMRLVHWPLIGGLLHLVQQGGDWAGPHSGSVSHSLSVCPSVRQTPAVLSKHLNVLLNFLTVGSHTILVFHTKRYDSI